MNVEQVIQLAREWVELYGKQMPGFYGAYLAGGINFMPPQAPFPPFCDVDVIVVLEGEGKSSQENLELEYKGLILECGFKGSVDYYPPESVLANPHIAPNLMVNSILSDPTGLLTETHLVVSQEFARRRWVIARCDYEKKRTLGCLDQLSQARSPFEALNHVWWFASFLSGVIAVASLRPPTHRKALVLMKELLQNQGRLDVYQELLSVLGFAHLSREKVDAYLEECSTAFERAVAVKRTSFPWDVKLHPHIRPYATDGAREMIDEGHHREAMFWIEAFWTLALMAIQNDAPEEEKPRFQAAFGCLLDDVGLRTPADWQSRLQKAGKLTEEVFKVADEIVDGNPQIADS